LFNHTDTNEFNQLIIVCRGVTDDSVMLQCFVSLTQTRTLLHPLLYPETPFSSIKEFFQKFSEISKQKNIFEYSQSVKIIKKYLPKAIEAFQTRTRSAGINSCYLLIKILDEGVFSIKGKYLYIIDFIVNGINIEIFCDIKDSTMDFDDLLEMRTTLVKIIILN
jgi:hypothetical protein